jgi:hypothetical protein
MMLRGAEILPARGIQIPRGNSPKPNARYAPKWPVTIFLRVGNLFISALPVKHNPF